MIGILCAMTLEAEKLIEKLEQKEVKKIAGMDFWLGVLNGKKVVISICSEGKVNSAMATQILIDHFSLECIVNVGIAGALDVSLSVCDVAIAKDCVEHDFDVTALGYEKGFVFGINTKYIPCDETESMLLYDIAKDKTNALYGTVASGDLFVEERRVVNKIKEKFNAIAVDMESASIAHVCMANGMKFACLRAISDTGNGLEYTQFASVATVTMTDILLEYLKRRI